MLRIICFILYIGVYADNTLINLNLETDFTVDDCLKFDNKKLDKYFNTDEQKFPYCEKYSTDQSCSNNNPCEPGLMCDGNSCKIDKNSCFKYFANANNPSFKEVLWKPSCLSDGSWSPKQCKGGIAGRCFCYDPKGKRIHGSAFVENSANMTCACSIRRFELMSGSNKRKFLTLHCDEMGNYEELQCDSGHCWCVDPPTGDSKSMIVPERMIEYLPCTAKSKSTNGQYLRKCESQAYAQALIIDHLKRHGTIYSNIEMVACQGDGGYGPYTIEGTSVYCVSEYNEKTTYQSTVSDIQSCNCHCSQDSQMYQQMGRPFTLQCLGNGNYKPFQSTYTDDVIKSFCVDQDGIKKVDNIQGEGDDNYCNNYEE